MVGAREVRSAGLASALFLLSISSGAFAQSTASFPAPAPTPPPAQQPPPLPPASVAPQPAYVPSPLPARPLQPGMPPRNALDNRYPVLPNGAPPPSALPQPSAPPAPFGLAPPVLPFESGMAVPPGYHAEYRYANGMIVGGVVTVGVAYAAGLLGSGGGNGLGWLAVPVVGPWGAMASRKFSCVNDPLQAQACVNRASHEVRTMALLSADAVVQATGAVLFFIGLGSGHNELVRNDQLTLRLAPKSVADGGFGLDLHGSF